MKLLLLLAGISALLFGSGCSTFHRELAIENQLKPYKEAHWEGDLSKAEYDLIEKDIRLTYQHYNRPQVNVPDEIERIPEQWAAIDWFPNYRPGWPDGSDAAVEGPISADAAPPAQADPLPRGEPTIEVDPEGRPVLRPASQTQSTPDPVIVQPAPRRLEPGEQPRVSGARSAQPRDVLPPPEAPLRSRGTRRVFPAGGDSSPFGTLEWSVPPRRSSDND
ncbi:MAG: hypothetical protein ACFB21_08610 [Opitutales bacterium]